jgi:transcriptional regulator with XRE-family HTH domain
MARGKPDLVDIEVAQRIKIQRLSAGLSLAQLGEKIGVSVQQAQKYESGANRIGIGRLTRIARTLKVSVNSFFEGRDMIERVAQKGVKSPLSLITPPYALRLLRAYSAITDEGQRRSILEMIEGIAANSGGKSARRTRR